MSLPTLVIDVVPLQITVSGSTAIITCNDSRARLEGDEIWLTIQDPAPNNPPVQSRVCFVIDDPADTLGYDNYLNMSSAPPLERLVAWKRSGTTSRSPEMARGCDVEVVAVAYSVPGTNADSSATVKVGHGRRRFKIRGPGGGGSNIF
jgi:hypothetical protein